MVKQNKSEIVVNGAGFGIANYTINLDNITTKVKEFYQITPVMVASDNNQYLLCDQIRQLEDGEFKELCIKIRLALIVGFNRLQSILSIDNTSSYDLIEELKKWNIYMNKLNERIIEKLLEDKADIESEELSEIMEYQGISEEEMNQAVKSLS